MKSGTIEEEKHKIRGNKIVIIKFNHAWSRNICSR